MEEIIPILDPKHPGINQEERLDILKARYEDQLIEDALTTQHFTIMPDGRIQVIIKQPISVVAGYIFEAFTVRKLNNQSYNFGKEIFKWITERSRLQSRFYEKFQAVGVGFPETKTNYPGYYNPTIRQFDVIFLRYNSSINRAEPATIVNTTIPGGLQVKAIRGNEKTEIINPLINGDYRRVLTYLRHLDGIHSYEVCIRELERMYEEDEISFDKKKEIISRIAYPEKFGIRQDQIDDYYDYIYSWYNNNENNDENIIKAIGMMSQETLNGSSIITEL